MSTSANVSRVEGDAVALDCEKFLNQMSEAGLGFGDVLSGMSRLFEAYAASESEGNHACDRPDISAHVATELSRLAGEVERMESEEPADAEETEKVGCSKCDNEERVPVRGGEPDYTELEAAGWHIGARGSALCPDDNPDNRAGDDPRNRVVNAAFEVHHLNGTPRADFAARYRGTKNDVIFLDDGTAHVVVRMDMLSWHGRPGRPLRRLDDIVAVYCGLEDEAYNEENYRKLLRGVYNGRRARVKTVSLAD